MWRQQSDRPRPMSIILVRTLFIHHIEPRHFSILTLSLALWLCLNQCSRQFYMFTRCMRKYDFVLLIARTARILIKYMRLYSSALKCHFWCDFEFLLWTILWDGNQWAILQLRDGHSFRMLRTTECLVISEILIDSYFSVGHWFVNSLICLKFRRIYRLFLPTILALHRWSELLKYLSMPLSWSIPGLPMRLVCVLA